MEDFEKKLHTLNNMKHTVTMTDIERNHMRAHLAGIVHGSRVAHVSPYHSYFSFSKMIRATVYIVIGVIIGGGSISYIGASTALPGDILYPVKTKIIEPAKGVFATTPESKLSYQENLMQTRLNEIDTLTKENKLNDQVITEVNQAITTQADQFDTAVLNVEQTGNTALANEKSKDLVNELQRREHILRMTKENINTNTAIDPQENKIANQLKNRRMRINQRLGIIDSEIVQPDSIIPIKTDVTNTTNKDAKEIEQDKTIQRLERTQIQQRMDSNEKQGTVKSIN